MATQCESSAFEPVQDFGWIFPFSSVPKAPHHHHHLIETTPLVYPTPPPSFFEMNLRLLADQCIIDALGSEYITFNSAVIAPAPLKAEKSYALIEKFYINLNDTPVIDSCSFDDSGPDSEPEDIDTFSSSLRPSTRADGTPNFHGKFFGTTSKAPDILDLVQEIPFSRIPQLKNAKNTKGELRYLKAYMIAGEMNKDGETRVVLIGHGYNSMVNKKRTTSVRLTRLRLTLKNHHVGSLTQFIDSTNPVTKRIWHTYIPQQAKVSGNMLQSFLSDFILFELKLKDFKNLSL